MKKEKVQVKNNPVLVVLLSIVILLALGTTASYAADSAGPGDLLYPIDLLAEDVQSALTISDEKKIELEIEILKERVEELEALEDDSEYIDTAVEKLTSQEDAVQNQYQEMEQKAQQNKIQEQEWERVRNRYQENIQEHDQSMEQIMNQNQELKGKVEQGRSNSNGGSGGSGKGN